MESGKRIALARLTVSQYDAILNHCDSIIFVTDGAGQIIYANDAAERGLNCSFEKMKRMDIYQFRKEGYTSKSSSEEAIRTRKKALVVYKNNSGEEIAATSIPVFDAKGNITMVVTRSNEMEYILEWQKAVDHYRVLYERALMHENSQAVKIIAESPQMKKSCLFSKNMRKPMQQYCSQVNLGQEKKFWQTILNKRAIGVEKHSCP